MCTLIASSAILKAQWVTHHNPVFQGNVTQPAVNTPITDLKFGTRVTRLTNSRSSGHNGIKPQYSKRQAWNLDETLMLLLDYGNGSMRLYNGATYQFIMDLPDVSGDDVFWSPTDPDLIFFNRDSVLNSYRVSNQTVTMLHDFAPYNFAYSNGEGNLSADGRYYAYVGKYYNFNTYENTFSDIKVYDLVTNKIISTMALPADLSGFDWVSVSPSGNYVVIDYADKETGRYHGVEVYDRNLNFIWQKPIGAGHSDLGYDGSNQEVLIMDRYDDNTNITHIMKFRLSDGQETELLELNQSFDLHISCRNQQRRGWCFISTFDYTDRLTDDSLSWLPFEDEVFALKMDGSGNVQRLAHHHSRRYTPQNYEPVDSTYAAEPHATVSRNGNRILFGSNWRLNMAESASVDTYVIDFTNLVGFDETVKVSGTKGAIFPNPMRTAATLRFNLDKESDIKLEIRDLTGKIIYLGMHKNEAAGVHEIPFTLKSAAPGLYIARLQTSKQLLTVKFEVVK
jgi:hypothetical protein